MGIDSEHGPGRPLDRFPVSPCPCLAAALTVFEVQIGCPADLSTLVARYRIVAAGIVNQSLTPTAVPPLNGVVTLLVRLFMYLPVLEK